jgi:5-methyltetrahydropteroyltriglutamate--homocysteine methyltransferase
VLEFARKGYDDVSLFKRYDAPNLTLGLGVIDVKRQDVETPEVVASRIRRALEVVTPERLVVNPDCGLRHLPADIARAKLHALTDGTAIVRKDLTGSS